MRRQRAAVVVEERTQPVDHLRCRELRERDDQRWPRGDAAAAVDDLGQLPQRPHAVLAGRLGQCPPRALVELLAVAQERLDLDAVVVHIERAPGQRRREHLAVAAHRGPGRRADPLVGELVVAPGDRHARRQPLEVPLERPGRRLVEVVEVEHEAAIGPVEHPEVGQVGVAAELDAQAAGRDPGQVGGHDRRAAPVEGERRDGHAAVADRHEVRHPGRVLCREQRDRVGPPGAGVELGVGFERDLPAQVPTRPEPLVRRRGAGHRPGRRRGRRRGRPHGRGRRHGHDALPPDGGHIMARPTRRRRLPGREGRRRRSSGTTPRSGSGTWPRPSGGRGGVPVRVSSRWSWRRACRPGAGPRAGGPAPRAAR